VIAAAGDSHGLAASTGIPAATTATDCITIFSEPSRVPCQRHDPAACCVQDPRTLRRVAPRTRSPAAVALAKPEPEHSSTDSCHADDHGAGPPEHRTRSKGVPNRGPQASRRGPGNDEAKGPPWRLQRCMSATSPLAHKFCSFGECHPRDRCADTPQVRVTRDGLVCPGGGVLCAGRCPQAVGL
jgi:hypothetical protein